MYKQHKNQANSWILKLILHSKHQIENKRIK